MPPELPKRLPPRKRKIHKIELEPGAKPPAMGPYRMAPPELEELRRQLKELLDTGFIQPSKAPYGVPVLFQKKHNGFLRMCIDYRGKVLHEARLKVDYYQVRIAEGDELKTTCVTRDGKLMMNDSKVKAIQEWDPPQGCSTTNFLKKNKAWEWDERCLDFAIGGVLMQEGTITFESRKLKTRRGVTRAGKGDDCHRPLLRLGAYLLGSHFIVKTDMLPLATSNTEEVVLNSRWLDSCQFDYTWSITDLIMWRRPKPQAD
ncbi:Transposon Ty3-G Gag-Pol polyprotein [Vitis vinifera]|uniref:Transposon Ty3-G Gag-Pol polyprotein n=1 Tax=Vitis vinifera TaxID=29760 RepID=A0A438FQL0_VITVI|nr:Transposon Ty3-G Gag-Pol polyprotein [Vitis vinifera]